MLCSPLFSIPSKYPIVSADGRTDRQPDSSTPPNFVLGGIIKYNAKKFHEFYPMLLVKVELWFLYIALPTTELCYSYSMSKSELQAYIYLVSNNIEIFSPTIFRRHSQKFICWEKTTKDVVAHKIYAHNSRVRQLL